MDKATKSLLVLDVKGSVPRSLLERLDRTGSVLVSRTVDEARQRIEAGACRAVLIALSEETLTTVSLAFFAREMHPGLPVMLLGAGFDQPLIQLAARYGLHLIVNDGDVDAVESSIAGRLEPSFASP